MANKKEREKKESAILQIVSLVFWCALVVFAVERIGQQHSEFPEPHIWPIDSTIPKMNLLTTTQQINMMWARE